MSELDGAELHVNLSGKRANSRNMGFIKQSSVARHGLGFCQIKSRAEDKSKVLQGCSRYTLHEFGSGMYFLSFPARSRISAPLVLGR